MLLPRPRRDVRRLPRATAPDGRIRCGLLTPALLYGGAERWLIDLIRATDARRLRWEGVALTLTSNRVAACVAQVPAPVTWGPGVAAELAARCDVLLSWGIPDWPDLLPSNRPPVILTSHGTCEFTRAAMSRSAEAEHLVAVAPVALAPIPDAERPRAMVLPNGVDPARCRPRISRTKQRSAWGVPAGSPVLGFLGRL